MVDDRRGGAESAKQKKGGFTKFPNELLEKLAKFNLSGGEVRVCLFVVRMTCGWNKTQDALAVSIIAGGTSLTERAVKKVISRLRGRNILLCQRSEIICKGTHLKAYAINHLVDAWLPEGVNGGSRVNGGAVRGERPCPEGVNGGAPTKETTKELTKETDRLSGAITDAVKYWCKQYELKLGVPYDFRAARDRSHLKAMFATFGEEWLRQIIDEFLDSQDPWIRDQGGFTIAVLRSQANKIAQSISSRDASGKSYMTEIPWER